MLLVTQVRRFCNSAAKLIKCAFLPDSACAGAGRHLRARRNRLKCPETWSENACRRIRMSAGNAGGPLMCFTLFRPIRGSDARLAADSVSADSARGAGSFSKAPAFTRRTTRRATEKLRRKLRKAQKPNRRPRPRRKPSQNPSQSPNQTLASPRRGLQRRRRSEPLFTRFRAVCIVPS